MQLVILAAGMGSRFGGLKQMEPMDDYGNFILDYSIHDAIRAGFDSVIFIIKREHLEIFRETIGKRVEPLIKTEYAFQDLNDLPEGFKCPEGREKPWGTAHAILAARDLIKDNFIIINGDDYYGQETYEVAAKYLTGLSKDSDGKYANIAFDVANTLAENGSVKSEEALFILEPMMSLAELSKANDYLLELKKIDPKTIKSPIRPVSVQRIEETVPKRTPPRSYRTLKRR